MEAEYTVHADDVSDDEVWQHDVEANVAELLVVAGQVGVQTRVKVTQRLHRLQHNLTGKTDEGSECRLENQLFKNFVMNLMFPISINQLCKSVQINIC